MMSSHVNVATRSLDYVEAKKPKDKSILGNMDPLHTDKLSIESIPQIPKGSAKRATINPNARAAQNYSTVEYLVQIPSTMSAL